MSEDGGGGGEAREPGPVAAVMMWRGCIAPYDSNNKITTSFTRDYDGEDASSASFRFLHSTQLVSKTSFQIFSLRTAAFSLITLARCSITELDRLISLRWWRHSK